MGEIDFCSFEQCVKLKELGFDWECDYRYVDNRDLLGLFNLINVHEFYHLTGVKITDDSVPAPTLSQAQKWLREVKDIIIGIDFDNWHEKHVCHVYKKIIYNSENIKDSYGSMLVTNESNEDFDSYEEALSMGIDAALELLK